MDRGGTNRKSNITEVQKGYKNERNELRREIERSKENAWKVLCNEVEEEFEEMVSKLLLASWEAENFAV